MSVPRNRRGKKSEEHGSELAKTALTASIHSKQSDEARRLSLHEGKQRYWKRWLKAAFSSENHKPCLIISM